MTKSNGIVRNQSGRIMAFTAEAIEELGRDTQQIKAATKDLNFAGKTGDIQGNMRRPGTGPGTRKLIRR